MYINPVLTSLVAIFLIGFFACSNPPDKKQPDPKVTAIIDRVLYPNTVLSALFDSIRPEKQKFIIKGDRDTLVVAKNGTTFSILKNTFVNSQGHPATTVEIAIVEANSIADIISSNLQTTSGDSILQTGGMFFIDAKENGKSLAIADGKSIFVETRSNFNNPQMKIFEGRFDSKSQIDWTASGNLENNLIAIPFHLLNFQAGLECVLSDKQIKSITQPQFENTFLATREFEQRALILNFTSCEQFNGLSQRLLDIYLSNTDKPLFISDSLAAGYLLKNYRTRIDSTIQFSFDETSWITSCYQSFLSFAQQHLTNTINFSKSGITESTTTEELVSKGYSPSDAEKYIAYYRLRKQVITTREDEKQTTRLASYTFAINKLGWINVDYFMNGQNMDASTFVVETKCKDTLDFISVSLVIPRYNISVFSIHNDSTVYSFTKKENGYRKLPVGEDALVVAFSVKDNKPYFGKQKIKIPKDGHVNVTLVQTTEQAIKSDISKLTE